MADSKLGQYGFYYDSVASEYKYIFKYWDDPRFGQHVFYYDMIQGGRLKYVFKYSANPMYGAYTFNYSPLDRIIVENSGVELSVRREKEILLANDVVSVQRQKTSNIFNTFETLLSTIGERFVEVGEGSVSTLSGAGFSQATLSDFIEKILYNSIRQDGLHISQEMILTPELRSRGIDVNNDMLGSSMIAEREMNYSQDLSLGRYDKGVIRPSSPMLYDLSPSDVIAKIKKDTMLVSSIEKIILVNSDVSISGRISTLKQEEGIDNGGQLNLRTSAKILNVKDIVELKSGVRNGFIEDKYSLERDAYEMHIIEEESNIVKRNKNDIVLNGSEQIKSTPRAIEVSHKEIHVKKIESKGQKKLDIEMADVRLSKGSKTLQIQQEHSHLNKDKKTLDITMSDTPLQKGHGKISNESETELNKGYRELDIESDVGLSKTFRELVSETEVELTKGHRDLFKDNDIRVSKGNKDIVVGNESLLRQHDKNIRKEEDNRLNKETNLSLHKEVENRLKLHKRFWFLKSIGEVDYKILPNRDFKYPASIEIFDQDIEGVYVYRYTDQFKELGSYCVRLHKEDLSIMAQHDVSSLNKYDKTLRNIRVKTNVKEIDEAGYKYEVSFEVYIHMEDVDYVVIKQPKGFKGNEFVFVASDKFLADNHPIPLGEDLGLREIPVSIAIMVDFMNILLLLWGKRLFAFSGMTGTQAINGMTGLVHQWVTLDTSLEAESIEDYHRCYRWFRWEAEKTYNKAKLDPNLSGNYWIEEVIFEMIDYMEMHHFNKMPEWDDVAIKMDEERNIFDDPQFDIPIVLDKFKGIRKRAITKNKRLND